MKNVNKIYLKNYNKKIRTNYKKYLQIIDRIQKIGQ